MDITGLGAIADLIKTGINKFVPDAEAKAANILAIDQLKDAADARILAAQMQTLQMQVDVNKVEASSQSTFVAGWRPAVGWICGFGFGYVTIIDPMARFVARVMFGYGGDFPVIDTTITMQALFGILGLAAARSYDKKKGTDATS